VAGSYTDSQSFVFSCERELCEGAARLSREVGPTYNAEVSFMAAPSRKLAAELVYENILESARTL
jgi:hypothetical protein